MIFFDIDDTLLDFKGAERTGIKAVYHQYGAGFHLDEQQFYDTWCAVGKKHFTRYLKGELSFAQQKLERVREVFGSVGTVLGEREAEACFQVYLESFESHWVPFDDVLPCLQLLKGHYRLGIVSNGDPDQQKSKLNKMGLAHYFDVMVTAGNVGAAKPDPRIFEIACKQAGKQPHECFYIGDDFSTDIESSMKINMKGIWLNRRQEKSPSKSAVTTITSLNQLEVVLSL
ncbi:MAG: 2-haloalkanoic acid dehalogenase [Paenibacillus sp.]|jgi:putative hydrolase of the HAD superfamily|nr:2-haloalkanoic acid dehalogenase [Paenibacillus sp.]